MQNIRRMTGRWLIASGVALAGMVWLPVQAQGTAQQASAKKDVTATASGEVRRVDAAAGKVTIKHGEISELELPAMTLVYQASPALLADIKPGDKVRFTAARQSGQYVVTEISN